MTHPQVTPKPTQANGWAQSKLFRRLEPRNIRTDANALPVTKGMLHDFIECFEEPQEEQEEPAGRRK
jgi:hypothetical protein